ncbi:MAG: Formamidopyrimidine-DNA glycosylase [uncultured Solirubrobacteraceae bacterium]|uniref:Formamidopyrimidine-DNA glycosylase n=1 Tax=uncultured Solirubrobacteraceae bacterium TaxID=1162706 RepID=A0A6J4T3L3_9ACTN|nr:MAG: Formamidopyrimidine-DNA glycosylase [uncultured Solirubrobacteraceae bacterium]
MPELPEVERARALIERLALDREIVSVDDADTYVCRPHAPGDIAGAITGRRLTRALRRGKAMWVETDGGEGPDLGLHLGMAGRIVIGDESGGDPIDGGSGGPAEAHVSGNPAWRRFTLEFADGGTLVLFDKRRLGRAVLNPDLGGVGPDAMEITQKDFRGRVGRGAAPLKARIMDQAVLAGVGNLLADETLWQAGLPPLRPAGSLSGAELDHLRRALRKATKAAIVNGGVHTGEVIAFRRRGERCPRCGSEMMRAAVGGRTTWWCSAEQSWDDAADRSAARGRGASPPG